MRGRQLGAYVAGLGAAGALLAGLFLVVGGRAVLRALGTADPALVAATLGFGLCWLFAWSLMLRTVLGTLGVDVPVGRAFLLYAGVVFTNNVTPFGQAGGEPVAALLVSRTSEARYETGLVGVATVDVLNVVPSLTLVFVGVGYYASRATVGDRLLTAVGTAVLIVAGVSTAMLLAWRAREILVDRASGSVAAVVARIASSRFEREAVERDVEGRLTRFVDHVEEVATNRRRLLVVLALSLSGWLFQGAALTAAFAAVGSNVPAAVVLFVIPLGNLAGAAPLPGGLGGIEAAFVVLLVSTTGIAAPVVTAAVLIYRAAIYWMPVIVGGSSVAAFGIRSTGRARRSEE